MERQEIPTPLLSRQQKLVGQDCDRLAQVLGRGYAVTPNTSLKLSANGVARWPSSAGPAAHFALAVQRATPSSPA